MKMGILLSLKTLEINTKQDFIKDEEKIAINNSGAKIKDSYEITSISENGINIVPLDFISMNTITYKGVD